MEFSASSVLSAAPCSCGFFVPPKIESCLDSSPHLLAWAEWTTAAVRRPDRVVNPTLTPDRTTQRPGGLDCIYCNTIQLQITSIRRENCPQGQAAR